MGSCKKLNSFIFDLGSKGFSIINPNPTHLASPKVAFLPDPGKKKLQHDEVAGEESFGGFVNFMLGPLDDDVVGSNPFARSFELEVMDLDQVTLKLDLAPVFSNCHP